MTGHVVHWDPVKAFGKITAERRAYFAHRDDLVDVLALVPGQRVTFEPIDDDPRGPRAADVRPFERSTTTQEDRP